MLGVEEIARQEQLGGIGLGIDQARNKRREEVTVVKDFESDLERHESKTGGKNDIMLLRRATQKPSMRSFVWKSE